MTTLSYIYGPDHDLSNLRDAYRHAGEFGEAYQGCAMDMKVIT